MTTLNSISNLSIQFQTLRLLNAGQQDLYDLQAQISSGKKTSDLSTLGATDGRNLLAARADEAKTNGYSTAIKTVQTRVKVQQTVLGNVQDIAAQVGTLISNNQTREAALTAGADSQLKSYLLQVQTYLNQQVENRNIFAGSRFGTQPVRDLNAMPVPPTEAYPYTPTTSGALPAYDTDTFNQNNVTSIQANNAAGTLTLGSSTWAAQGYSVGDTVTLTGVRGIADGTTFTIGALSGATATVTPLPTSGSTFTQAAATSIAANNAASTLTLGSSTWAAQGVQVGDSITLTGTGADGTYSVTNLAGGVATVSPAPTTIAADTSFSVTSTNAADTAFTAVRNSATTTSTAYDKDALYIADGFSLQYGVSSNDPAFQNLILGLRWAYAATQDSANYTSYMAKASDLIGTATSQLRVLESDTAANQGVLTNTLAAAKSSIVDYQDKAGSIIDADVNGAATQLSILSAQINASYAATGRVIKLSIVNYL